MKFRDFLMILEKRKTGLNNRKYELIQTIAKSQSPYPDGIGVDRSLFAMRQVVAMGKPLDECSIDELKEIIRLSRYEYRLLKYKTTKKPLKK